MDVYLDVIKNRYAKFDGRAGLREFWMFTLFNVIFSLVTYVIDLVIGTPALNLIYSLAVLVPGLAIAVRRLHDVGKPWPFILLVLIPCLGPLILTFAFFIKAGDAGDNEFGPAPAAAPSA